MIYKNRKKFLKARNRRFKWAKIGFFGESKCPLCGEKGLIFIDKYDAWACMLCNNWLENVCGDPKCPFCSNRPETPYEVYFNNNAADGLYRKMWRRKNYQHKKDGEIRHKKRKYH